MKAIKIGVIAIRMALGALFIYGGISKFAAQPQQEQGADEEAVSELPEHVVKIKALIGGMKQTGYFWPMLGTAELLCGLLLISQVLALLGAVMLVPLTLNIFLFHACLTPHETGELFMALLYLLANLALLAYDYPKLKETFLPLNKQ